MKEEIKKEISKLKNLLSSISELYQRNLMPDKAALFSIKIEMIEQEIFFLNNLIVKHEED